MAWYRSGTVSVINGGVTVIGSGTAWASPMVMVGYAFMGPDGGLYEIAAINTSTEITLTTPYGGPTAATQAYGVIPTQSLNVELHKAAQTLVQTVNQKIDPLDDQIAAFDQRVTASQAAYNALAANLAGVVNNQMNFVATVDPDDPAPTNVDGGTFTSIADAVNASPAGSYCEVRLQSGKTHLFNSSLYMLGRNIRLMQSGGGAKPVVDVVAYANATHNILPNFNPRGGGSVSFQNCDIRLPTAPVNPSLPWSVSKSLVSYVAGRMSTVTIDRSIVSGGIAGAGFGLAMAYVGGSATLGIYSTTFDGPIFGIIGFGAKIVTRYGVTLQNGAAILESGTVGVDVLQY